MLENVSPAGPVQMRKNLPPSLQVELVELEKKYEDTLAELRKMIVEVQAAYAQHGLTLTGRSKGKTQQRRPRR